MEKEKLCLRCMRKIGNSSVCPYCRNERNEVQKDPYLPLKTVVGGRYLVGKLIENNGEGSTYNAFDLEAKKPVTLRELYPKGLLSRGEGNYCLVNVGKASEYIDYKDSFIKLWRKLSTLNGYKALTPATDVFEDLGTVYAVTEFLGEGQTLREYLLNKEQGYISWEEARVLLSPVLSALGELHSAGIVHGGISPTTLVIDVTGQVRITGYSIADMRTEKSNMVCQLFEGYAAVEQYGMSQGLNPSTDIYAFAAVLYRALIGSTPMSSASRLTNDKLMIPGKFAEQLPAYVINALVNALQILPEDRTQSAEQLRDELSASPVAAGTAAEAYSSAYSALDDLYGDDQNTPEPFDEGDDYEEEEAPAKSKKGAIIAAVVSSVIGVLIIILAVIGFSKAGEPENELTTDVSESVSDTTDAEETEVTSIRVPDFRGMNYQDDIKDNPDYKGFIVFQPTFEESEEERGVVISQQGGSIGRTVFSDDPITISITISEGLSVPDVIGDDVDDAIKTLKKAGFKSIKKKIYGPASSPSQENEVASVVVLDDNGEWVVIADNISSKDTIIVYYYEGEETTKETTKATTEATEAETSTEAPATTTQPSTTEAPVTEDTDATDEVTE